MKNFFGHDDDSEIFTIITKLRQNKFEILSFSTNTFLFRIRIVLPGLCLPTCGIMRSDKIVERDFILSRVSDRDFVFTQINGKDPRFINFVDGYIIWSLLEEKLTPM